MIFLIDRSSAVAEENWTSKLTEKIHILANAANQLQNQISLRTKMVFRQEHTHWEYKFPVVWKRWLHIYTKSIVMQETNSEAVVPPGPTTERSGVWGDYTTFSWNISSQKSNRNLEQHFKSHSYICISVSHILWHINYRKTSCFNLSLHMTSPIKYTDVTYRYITLVYRIADFVSCDDFVYDIYTLLKWLVVITKPRYFLSFKLVG